MATELRITDGCPHCGQQVMVVLASAPLDPAGRVSVPVLVDPAAAQLHAADPTADHPCPGPGTTGSPTDPVPEDHAS